MYTHTHTTDVTITHNSNVELSTHVDNTAVCLNERTKWKQAIHVHTLRKHQKKKKKLLG